MCLYHRVPTAPLKIMCSLKRAIGHLVSIATNDGVTNAFKISPSSTMSSVVMVDQIYVEVHMLFTRFKVESSRITSFKLDVQIWPHSFPTVVSIISTPVNPFYNGLQSWITRPLEL